MTNLMAELLLEIGCEEIPAPWLPGLREQLRQKLGEAATREHLAPTALEVHSTPRRLVLFAEVRARQEDREDVVFGPSLKVARDASGNWTGAATGFARKNGTTPDTLQSAPKDPSAPDDLYLRFVKKTAGRAATEVLPAVMAATLRALAFPKRMSWDAWLDDGKGAFPFGRPIRWIVALLDGKVVPFTIHELVAGAKGPVIVDSAKLTRGHRFLPRGSAAPIAVASVAEYREKLRAAFVILDPAEREVRIREGLAAAGEVRDDHGLIEEWRELVEYPTVVSGTIPPEFASLPPEVLETVLVHHQKYIPLVLEDRSVTRFAALTGTDEASSPAIVRGMERVVVARLRDGAFFFAEDLRRPLSDRVPDLAGVTFHQKLGSYREKADRMVKLVDAMHRDMRLLSESEHRAASEAARLAKADLTTLMVREFPELQGVMGGVYLRAQRGASESVATAVQWHYHPVSIEEHSPPLPSQVGDPNVFGAVSIADKLDTLVGYFGIGEDPTGSRDPYGLRRSAQGVIRVLLDFWQVDAAEGRPNLPRLIEAAITGYQKTLVLDAEARKGLDGALKLFLLDRLEYVLVSRGYAADEVAAVLYTDPLTKYPLDDPYDCLLRVQALHKVRAEVPQDYEHLAVAFKRASSLLTQAQKAPDGSRGLVLTGVLPEREEFKEPAERHLYDVLMAQDFGPSGGLLTYEQQFRALATRRPAVDRFFDEVMVMVEDADVRQRRLGLLHLTIAPILRIADISRLGGQA